MLFDIKKMTHFETEAYKCCLDGNLERLKRIHIVVDLMKYNYLAIASSNNNFDVVKFLLEEIKYPPSINDYECIQIPMRKGNVKIAAYIWIYAYKQSIGITDSICG